MLKIGYFLTWFLINVNLKSKIGSKTTTASMGPTSGSSVLSSSNNNMTTTSPISIKIETHSPVHLKSTSNLYADSTLSTSSSLTTTPNHHQYQQQQQQQQIRHIPILPAQQTPNAHSQSHSQQQSPTNSSSSSDQKFNGMSLYTL